MIIVYIICAKIAMFFAIIGWIFFKLSIIMNMKIFDYRKMCQREKIL